MASDNIHLTKHEIGRGAALLFINHSLSLECVPVPAIDDEYPYLTLHNFRYRNRKFRMSNIQQQRLVVEQLRREASIKRISVSQAIEDLKVLNV